MDTITYLYHNLYYMKKPMVIYDLSILAPMWYVPLTSARCVSVCLPYFGNCILSYFYWCINQLLDVTLCKGCHYMDWPEAPFRKNKAFAHRIPICPLNIAAVMKFRGLGIVPFESPCWWGERRCLSMELIALHFRVGFNSLRPSDTYIWQ